MKEFDFIIIGAGSAGLSARSIIAKHTDNYVVIDDGKLGTTCARVGCMPSKVIIQTANDFYRRHKLAEQGISYEKMSLDSRKVMQHVRKLRDRFVRGVMGGMESWMSESNFIRKRARFIDPHTLDLGDETIRGKKIILATGSSAFIPQLYRDLKDYIVTTDEVFEMEQLPESIAVIGTGIIGIELGQAMHRLGVKTKIFGRRRVIAGIQDPIIAKYTAEHFENEIPMYFGDIDSVESKDGVVNFEYAQEKFQAEKILIVAGRKPNLSSLNLESLGIEQDVPDFDLSTFSLKQHPHIYLPGDVNNQRAILHEASDEGKLAALNAINNNQRPHKMRTKLEIAFCDPNIARVGLNLKELKDGNYDFQTGEVSFEGQGRSIVKLKEVGLLHVYGDTQTGKILGAESFGPDTEHLAHLLSWAIEANLTVNELLSYPFYHPVVEEGLRTALRDLRSKVQESIPDLELKELV